MGLAGPPGIQGQQGQQGVPGILRLVTVEGADAVIPANGYGSAPNANCPDGMRVVGTGFYGPHGRSGGFVKSYTYFVGGFFVNDSSIPTEVHVQAICAQLPAGVSAAARSKDRANFEQDVADAKRALTQ